MKEQSLELHKTYYKTGELRSMGCVKDGEGVGEISLFHRNGRKFYQFNLENGLVHGEVRYWNEGGELLDAYFVDRGTGPCRSWHENGRLASDGQARKGRYIGKVVIWDTDGRKLSTNYYIDGAEVPKRRYLEMAKLDKTFPPID